MANNEEDLKISFDDNIELIKKKTSRSVTLYKKLFSDTKNKLQLDFYGGIREKQKEDMKMVMENTKEIVDKLKIVPYVLEIMQEQMDNDKMNDLYKKEIDGVNQIMFNNEDPLKPFRDKVEKEKSEKQQIEERIEKLTKEMKEKRLEKQKAFFDKQEKKNQKDINEGEVEASKKSSPFKNRMAKYKKTIKLEKFENEGSESFSENSNSTISTSASSNRSSIKNIDSYLKKLSKTPILNNKKSSIVKNVNQKVISSTIER